VSERQHFFLVQRASPDKHYSCRLTAPERASCFDGEIDSFQRRRKLVMLQVDERNQDDLSRLAGCYLYAGTHISVEDGLVHREDGPAVIFPNGVVRWYLRGREVTRAVNSLFYDNKWPLAKGLDTTEKRTLFAETFLR
jgi:hypothetical protein